MANQAKLRSFRTAPCHKYGFEIPCNYEHAVKLDEQNGNTRWQDATTLEIELICSYSVFKSIGYKAVIPHGYKRI